MSETPLKIVEKHSTPYELSPYLEEHVKKAMHEDVYHISSLFKILSDPVRLRILKALELCDLCVCVLVEITDYKYPALSYHLKLLKDGDLVNSRREGNYQIYYITDLGVKTVSALDVLVE